MQTWVDHQFPTFIGGLLGKEETEKYFDATAHSRKTENDISRVFYAACGYLVGLSMHRANDLMDKEQVRAGNGAVAN